MGHGKGFPSPDLISYGSGISACGKAARWQESLVLLSMCFDRLRQQKCVPDIICFNAAIDASGRGWQWAHSLQLLFDMCQLRVSPDVVSFSSTVAALQKSSRWQMALATYATQEYGAELDVFALTAALSAAEKGRQWQAALSMLMKSQHVADRICFEAAMGASQGSCQWELSLSLLTQMADVMVARGATSFATAVRAASTASKWKHAVSIVGTCDGLVDGFALNSLLRALSFTKLERSHRLWLLCALRVRKPLQELRQGAGLAELVELVSLATCYGTGFYASRLLRRRLPAHVVRAGKSRHGLSDLGPFAAEALEVRGFCGSKDGCWAG